MSDRPNLLMICVDDLRPLMRCYGHEQMHTPAFDRLAESGVLFEKAFCQVPVCGASRASLLTGIRPTPQRFLEASTWVDEDAPDVPTLIEHLRDHGYITVGNHKVFHHAGDRRGAWHAHNDGLGQFPGPYHTDAANRLGAAGQARAMEAGHRRPKRGPATECADIPDTAQQDGVCAEWAIRQLHGLVRRDQPFALCYGSVNVHLPFKAPKRYWDLYDRDALPLPGHQEPPTDVPPAALHNYGELRNYGDIPDDGPVDDASARQLVHGYRAGVSYLDAQVGKLLDTLDELGVADNTIVVLWVDHGFNLGEHGLWCKHCLYETSLHVPLIIRAPGRTAGTSVRTVVENLDVYPTVCELLGLAQPAHLKGRTLTPLIDDPAAPRDAYAVSRFRNGDSIRTQRYRYSQLQDEQGNPAGCTLFDLEADPGETRNLADDPSHAEVARDLHQRLKQISSDPGP